MGLEERTKDFLEPFNKQLDVHDMAFLEQPFTEEEVRKAMFQIEVTNTRTWWALSSINTRTWWAHMSWRQSGAFFPAVIFSRSGIEPTRYLYLRWINQKRSPNSGQSVFVMWFTNVPQNVRSTY